MLFPSFLLHIGEYHGNSTVAGVFQNQFQDLCGTFRCFLHVAFYFNKQIVMHINLISISLLYPSPFPFLLFYFPPLTVLPLPNSFPLSFAGSPSGDYFVFSHGL
jgi:hypothetical protein